MGLLGLHLPKDIVIDDEKFNNASREFANLSKDIKDLRKDINNMLEDLKKGFDTPAGRKFVAACEEYLLKPMDDQVHVIEHVSSNLSQAKNMYQSVFSDYKALNSLIGR